MWTSKQKQVKKKVSPTTSPIKSAEEYILFQRVTRLVFFLGRNASARPSSPPPFARGDFPLRSGPLCSIERNSNREHLAPSLSSFALSLSGRLLLRPQKLMK